MGYLFAVLVFDKFIYQAKVLNRQCITYNVEYSDLFPSQGEICLRVDGQHRRDKYKLLKYNIKHED